MNISNVFYHLNFLLSKSANTNIMVIDALGKDQNLILVEHYRRYIFTSDKWDCVAFMFADEELIPDTNPHLRNLVDELECSVPRTPGVQWGSFLQFITPTFVSHYDHIAIVLDDVFMPHKGLYAIKPDIMLKKMGEHGLGVIQPGIIGDTWNRLQKAKDSGIDKCLVKAFSIETYLQIFTREAWSCYYSMLQYTGSRGWCYDVCYHKQCPDIKMAHDFSMRAWHMDRSITRFPKYYSKYLNSEGLKDWKPVKKIYSQGYYNKTGLEYEVCEKFGCDMKVFEIPMKKIICPQERFLRK